jgi:quercetin dioxygenase-like cupin family protein
MCQLKKRVMLRVLVTIPCMAALGLMFSGSTAARGDHREATVTPLIKKEFENIPGKEGLMIQVEYPPGYVGPVHRHDAHAFVYVLEGSIVMGLKGGKDITLTAGQTFYEGPNDLHTVGRNASTSKRAKFVVVLVQETGAPVLTPVK